MVTKEEVILWFTRIHNKCNRIITANYSHDIALIRSLAFNYADKIKTQYDEIMIYDNLIRIIELASRVTAGNLAHKIATIKGLCLRNIDFINEFGLVK
jgi:hypothetical protein